MTNGTKRMMCVIIVFLSVWFVVLATRATEAEKAPPVQEGVEQAEATGSAESVETEKTEEAEKLKEQKEAAEKAKREAAEEAKQKAVEEAKAKVEEQISRLNLPEDTTQKFTVKELQISGNTLIPTANILKNMPLIYNASDKSLSKAESKDLYDLRPLLDVIAKPGEAHQVSARTIQGFTQYILSIYQKYGYAGIYAYVPSEVIVGGAELKDGILPVEVLEAAIADVNSTAYDAEHKVREKGYLKKSAIMKWSPAKAGQPLNKKELDDFINLLNLDPDRYVSATVSKGTEPKSLNVAYNIYEVNPWHYFIQLDNSGTEDRRWSPVIGVINTNLLGYDDRFIAVYQAKPESGIENNYAAYGSYDFPVLGPKLRLNLYGSHSEFDIGPAGTDISYLGRGTVYGGVLRFNLLQTGGWFFNIKGTLEHTRSKVTPSLFPEFLESDVKFWLWGAGAELHRRNDMSDTAVSLDRYESWGGDKDDFALARTNAKPDFGFYAASARHGMYMDPNKIQRLSGTFKWIWTEDRLVPAKMSAFGGMYTIRGYDEYEFVADGGIVASAQYEFDIVKYEQAKEKGQPQIPDKDRKPYLRKLAPLVFLDYGRATIVHPTATEKRHEELFSIGPGLLTELGDNFSGAVYYGYPLTHTEETRTGKGRVSVGLMMRW